MDGENEKFGFGELLMAHLGGPNIGYTLYERGWLAKEDWLASPCLALDCPNKADGVVRQASDHHLVPLCRTHIKLASSLMFNDLKLKGLLEEGLLYADKKRWGEVEEIIAEGLLRTWDPPFWEKAKRYHGAWVPVTV